ncbi:RNA-binding protein YhbY [hydrothermal vent metagenome]|uniref:RNA-binding protein YhbY n=1 Tax=hydrothermal vent metagenome TaxID=652676 RepID=A0A3B0XS98_9ZZZZ
MPLSRHQIKYLTSLAHNLKPVVMIGQNGITENVLKELEIALDFHELVKIKIAGDDKDERAEMIEKLINESSADVVQKIGKTLSLYRKNNIKPKITLPKR